MMDNTWT